MKWEDLKEIIETALTESDNLDTDILHLDVSGEYVEHHGVSVHYNNMLDTVDIF